MIRVAKDDNILALIKVIVDRSPVNIEEMTIEKYDSIDIQKCGTDNLPCYRMTIWVNSRVSYEISCNERSYFKTLFRDSKISEILSE